MPPGWLPLPAFSLAILLSTLTASAQEESYFASNPVPQKISLSQRGRDHRQACIAYGSGLLAARDNRLLEATRLVEEAWRLEPTAAPVGRLLVRLDLALGRSDEALALSKKVLDLDPNDFETWYSFARQLRERGSTKEALDAMTKAVACPALKERPHELGQLTFDLAVFFEDASELDNALTVLRRAEGILLEHRQSLVNSGQVGDEQLYFEEAKTSEKIAHVCVKLKKYDDAARSFEMTQRIAQENLNDSLRAARLNLDLAKAYYSAGHREKSLQALDEFLRTQPADVQPYQLRITLLKDLGRQAEIIPSLAQLVSLDRHNLELRLLLAEQYAAGSAHWNKAQREYEEIIRESPSARAFQGLFGILKKQRKVEEILFSLDRSLAAANPQGKSPGDVSEAMKARAMLDALRQDSELIRQLIPVGASHGRRGQRLDSSTRYFLAMLAARTNQLEAAESFYQSCLQEPGEFPGFSQEHELYSGLLRVLSLQGKNEEIIKTCKEGLRSSRVTNRLLFHEYLGSTLSRLGRTEEALAEADQAVQLADEKSRLHYQLAHARILSESNQHDQAIKECQDLLQKTGSSDDIHEIRLTLYWIYSSTHENVKAEEQLRRILQDFPDDATAHNDLGYLMADQAKNLPEAEELIRRAIELDRRQKNKEAHVGPDDDQDNAAFVDSLGWVLFRLGRFQDALRELERAATLQMGDDPVIWDHLGDVYFRMEQAPKARQAWRKAVDLYEKERRRKQGEQYKELKRKLELLDIP
jgi:tetratricopeptide (TPR) repeat protein